MESVSALVNMLCKRYDAVGPLAASVIVAAPRACSVCVDALLAGSVCVCVAAPLAGPVCVAPPPWLPRAAPSEMHVAQ